MPGSWRSGSRKAYHRCARRHPQLPCATNRRTGERSYRQHRRFSLGQQARPILLGQALAEFLRAPMPLCACLVLKRRPILLMQSATDILWGLLIDPQVRADHNDQLLIREHLELLRLALIKGIDTLIAEVMPDEDTGEC